MKKIIYISSIFVFCILGCSKKSSDGTTTESGFFPTIDFTVPATATTTSVENYNFGVLSVSGTNVLTEWGTKMTQIIDYINNFFVKLNVAQITSGSGVSHTLANGNTITVTVADVLNDANYQHQAIICTNSNKFLYVKWNDAKDKVLAIRDLNYNPQNIATTYNKNLIVEVDYSVNSSGDKTVQFYGNGQPWIVPTDVSSDTTNGGGYLIDHVTGVKKSDNSFTFTGVNAWETTFPTSSYNGDTNGDVWLVGKLSEDGSGNFLVNRRFNTTLCSSYTPFTESTPNWCFGADVSTTGVPTFFNNSNEINSAWNGGLNDIGATNDSTLKSVSFPTGVNCNLIQ